MSFPLFHGVVTNFVLSRFAAGYGIVFAYVMICLVRTGMTCHHFIDPMWGGELGYEDGDGRGSRGLGGLEG